MEHEKKHAGLLEQYLKHAELIAQPNTKREIELLPTRWAKFAENNGDYIVIKK
jgi:hypothetical protein